MVPFHALMFFFWENVYNIKKPKKFWKKIIILGVLLNFGTRSEDSESSGSLLAIKNTYLKTVLNTNETVN